MKIAATLAILLCVSIAGTAAAAPDRESLVAAWEVHVRSLPGTESLEASGDETYRLKDSDLPYDGELKIRGVLVRPNESTAVEMDFSHLGMIEMELTDLPKDRLTSQVYYYWLADRQTLHYSVTEDRWVNTAEYQAALTEMYSPNLSLGPLSFMLNWGIWIGLGALVIFVWVALGKQTRKARGLMDDTEAINQKASDNLDRAQSMQDEVLAIARETRDLQAENNELLKQMLEALKR